MPNHDTFAQLQEESRPCPGPGPCPVPRPEPQPIIVVPQPQPHREYREYPWLSVGIFAIILLVVVALWTKRDS